MNWTGGSLQRSKNANKGVIQKQRAHFARARTKLQQSPDTLATHFRPDFVQAGADHGLGRRCSASSGSVRRAGRSARQRGERVESHESPAAQRLEWGSDCVVSHGAGPHLLQNASRYAVAREIQQDGRRKRIATDIETELLEANRRRLTKQQHWAGTEPSKPAGLHYPSAKEKTQFGKRRKLDNQSKAASRRSPVTFPYRSGHTELGGHYDTYMSGALPVPAAADNIRVRIGSDALTTVASTQIDLTQPINYAPSHTSTDSMLFDEEVNNTAAQRIARTPQGGFDFDNRDDAGPISTAPQPVEVTGSCSTQRALPRYHNLTRTPDKHADERKRHSPVMQNTLDQVDPRSEATQPSYRLTHHVGGIERPFKLAFDGGHSGRVERNASPTDTSGETQHVRGRLYAEDLERGHAQRRISKNHQTAVRRQACSSAIDDPEPWRSYLDMDTCRPGKDARTATSVLQPHVAARKTKAESTCRPQHGVQGDLTHVNLSALSASAPFQKRPSARPLEARPLLPAAAPKGYGKDEMLWKSFALGSDPQSAIETIHTLDEISDDSTLGATKGYASTRQPLSRTVTPVSSTPSPCTPYRSLSGEASRISDDVQHAPRSGSRSIISAAPSRTMWGGVSPMNVLPVLLQGDETSAGSLFGEHSTHASTQNHASQFIDVSSSTRKSRNTLDRHSRARDDVSKRAHASGSDVWQRDRESSMWNGEDSDDTGIDLVDVDRLT